MGVLHFGKLLFSELWKAETVEEETTCTETHASQEFMH